MVRFGLERTARAIRSFNLTVAGLERRAPDILIITEAYSAGLVHEIEVRFFADLFAGRSSYREVAKIRYQALPWPDPDVTSVNPTVRIYRRTE